MSNPVFSSLCCCLAILSGLALVGCSGDEAAQSQPAENENQTAENQPAGESGTPHSEVTLVNAVCPMMGGKAKTTVTANWNGKTVGFCCPECIPEWEQLTGEEKASKLTAAEKPADEAATADENPAT
jgi:hypothetical protein